MKLNGIWVGVSLLVTLGATAACGGDDNDGGGKAGSGNAGSTTQAGSGGSGTAGSAAQGGTATGVSGSVGTAGSGTAGSGTAGSGTAGSTGTGGGAGGGDCAALCTKPTVKACMGEFCVDTCTQAQQQFLAFFPECSAQWNAQFACIAKQPNENVMCEGSIITSPACSTEKAALEACGN